MPGGGASSASDYDVTVEIYAKEQYTDVVECRPIICVNDTVYYGTNYIPTGSYAVYTHTWTTNPDTGSEWTKADIDSLEAGCYGNCTTGSTGGALDITSIRVRVDYAGDLVITIGPPGSMPGGFNPQYDSFDNAESNIVTDYYMDDKDLTDGDNAFTVIYEVYGEWKADSAGGEGEIISGWICNETYKLKIVAGSGRPLIYDDTAAFPGGFTFLISSAYVEVSGLHILANTTDTLYDEDHALYISNVNNVTVTDCILDSTTTPTGTNYASNLYGSNLIIDNCTITGMDGIYDVNAGKSNITISNCLFEDITGDYILYKTSGTGVTVRGCVFRNCADDFCILLAACDDFKIYNNIINASTITQYAIFYSTTSATHTQGYIVNNTVYGVPFGVYGISLYNVTDGNTQIRNNLIHLSTNGLGMYYCSSTTTYVTCDNNCVYQSDPANGYFGYHGTTCKTRDDWYAATGMDCSSIEDDPGFLSTDPASPDWLHVSPDSPCIEKGTNFYGVFTTDFDGQTRPPVGDWCIGADEVVTLLEPPANFRCEDCSSTTLTWAWDDINGELGYAIYDNGTDTIVVSNIGADNISTVETGLTPNTTYTRYIKAYRDKPLTYYYAHDALTSGLSATWVSVCTLSETFEEGTYLIIATTLRGSASNNVTRDTRLLLDGATVVHDTAFGYIVNIRGSWVSTHIRAYDGTGPNSIQILCKGTNTSAHNSTIIAIRLDGMNYDYCEDDTEKGTGTHSTLTISPPSLSNYLYVHSLKARSSSASVQSQTRTVVGGGSTAVQFHGYSEPCLSTLPGISHGDFWPVINISSGINVVESSLSEYKSEVHQAAIRLSDSVWDGYACNCFIGEMEETAGNEKTVVSKTFTPDKAQDYLILASCRAYTKDMNSQVDIWWELDGVQYDYFLYRVWEDFNDKFTFATIRKVNLDTSSHSLTMKFKKTNEFQADVANASIIAIPLEGVMGVEYGYPSNVVEACTLAAVPYMNSNPATFTFENRNTITVRVGLNGNPVGTPVELFVAPDADGGPGTFASLGTRNGGYTWDVNNLTAQTPYWFKSRARNSAGIWTDNCTDVMWTTDGDYDTQTLPFKGYHMLDLPRNPTGKTFQQLFGDEIGGSLIIYFWNESGNSWDPVDVDTVPQADIGYLIWAWYPGTVLGMDGDALPGSGQDTLYISCLDNNHVPYYGYHLIRNPFGVDLDWPGDFTLDNCENRHWRPWNGEEYEWCINASTKTDNGSEFIPPGASFWVHCTMECGSITMDPSLSGAPRPLPPPALMWRARLLTHTGTYKDTYTYFGVKDDASTGYDDFDVVEIRSLLTKYVQTYFDHPEWGRFAGPYTQDMRPFPVAGGKVTWDFTVHATDADNWINLSWILPEEAKDCWIFILRDNYSGLVKDMAIDDCIEYMASGDDTRSFTITAIEQLRPIMGDTNLDGEVTLEDAALCARAEHGIGTLTPEQRYVSDLNSDGKVDTFDALLILRRLNGHIPGNP
ncbi:MAG: right-handed parallel beta-helix repeat-containing protein [Planctomycetota bacterium]